MNAVFNDACIAASCPSFTSSVEEGRAVCPGEELTYTCTIFDDTSLYATTIWNASRIGSNYCPDYGNLMVLTHGLSSEELYRCGPFTAQATGSDGDCYTSTLTVTASPELNGTVIQCIDGFLRRSNDSFLYIVGKMCLFSSYAENEHFY